MKALLLLTSLVGLTFVCHAQIDNAKIDKKDLRTLVKILTSDSLEGRGTGTEGQKKAARFISKQFNELGLKSYNGPGYLEIFKLNETYWGQVYLKTPGKVLRNFENMVFQGSDAQNDETEKEVVFGGFGSEDELAQIEVAGRFVLVFLENLRATYDINTRLRRLGASGLIVANPENNHQFESIKNTFRDYSLQKRLSFPDRDAKDTFAPKWDTVRFINTITIPNSEIGHVFGLSQGDLRRLVREGRIADAPVGKIRIKFERIENEIETANVIGAIPGKSDTTIVLSAHYDHLGKNGKTYFPGADDNASGIAALLEIAEAVSRAKELRYSLVFLATSGEEAGLLGSFYHVNRPEFNPKKILCDLNLDMISRIDDKHSDKGYLYCIGTDQSKKMAELIAQADSLYGECAFDYSMDNSTDPSGLFTRSDNYNFYRKGIPAIQFFSGLHEDYHKTTDTADKIDFQNLEHRVRQIALVIDMLQRGGLED